MTSLSFWSSKSVIFLKKQNHHLLPVPIPVPVPGKGTPPAPGTVPVPPPTPREVFIVEVLICLFYILYVTYCKTIRILNGT